MLKEADIVLVMGVLLISVIIVNMYHDYLYMKFVFTDKPDKKKQITMVVCLICTWAFAIWNSRSRMPGSILVTFFMYAASISGSVYCCVVLFIVNKKYDTEKKHLRFYFLYLFIFTAIRIMSFILTELAFQHRSNMLLK